MAHSVIRLDLLAFSASFPAMFVTVSYQGLNSRQNSSSKLDTSLSSRSLLCISTTCFSEWVIFFASASPSRPRSCNSISWSTLVATSGSTGLRSVKSISGLFTVSATACPVSRTSTSRGSRCSWELQALLTSDKIISPALLMTESTVHCHETSVRRMPCTTSGCLSIAARCNEPARISTAFLRNSWPNFSSSSYCVSRAWQRICRCWRVRVSWSLLVFSKASLQPSKRLGPTTCRLHSIRRRSHFEGPLLMVPGSGFPYTTLSWSSTSFFCSSFSAPVMPSRSACTPSRAMISLITFNESLPFTYTASSRNSRSAGCIAPTRSSTLFSMLLRSSSPSSRSSTSACVNMVSSSFTNSTTCS
mmetsp:Transcript_9263/g.27401  ORF Transcript_9263/g.27401 Transcript_9263/m.27401 type:complete len:360 (-) Transcript_9263:1783-2862(-)